MSRLLLAGGATTLLISVAIFIPAVVAHLEEGTTTLGTVVVFLAGILALSGAVAILLGFRRWHGVSMPAPVRAVVVGNILLLAFCALETSDRLLRQEGKIFYWTTFLLMPTLLQLCGALLAQRWAWWTMRGVTTGITLWFVVFLGLIPFADLRGDDGPVPWWGRIYMAGVTLIFAGISAYVFFGLGRVETRDYFGISRRIEPTTVADPAGR
jgi:hypothetical protein